MATLKLSRRQNKLNIEFDLGKIEKMCNALGLFREEFLESIDEADKEFDEMKGKTLEEPRTLLL